ncbi:hypothetical protein NKH18_20830 [Streptomyces sp. M10(2022)]
MMRFQVLGPLTLADGPDAVVLQPSKPTILLAALLLRANTVVSAEYLQRAVWARSSPPPPGPHSRRAYCGCAGSSPSTA